MNNAQRDETNSASAKQKAIPRRGRSYVAVGDITFGDVTERRIEIFDSGKTHQEAARIAIRKLVAQYHFRWQHVKGSNIPNGVVGVRDVEIVELISFPKGTPFRFVEKKWYDSRWTPESK